MLFTELLAVALHSEAGLVMVLNSMSVRAVAPSSPYCTVPTATLMAAVGGLCPHAPVVDPILV